MKKASGKVPFAPILAKKALSAVFRYNLQSRRLAR